MKQWALRAASALGVLALTFSIGCDGFFFKPGSTGGGTGAAGNYVYVANATAGTVAGFVVGKNTLSAVANSPYNLGFSLTSVAVNPANNMVFVSGNGAIYAFAIGSSGELSLLNNGSAVGLANVVSMDVSPDGQWLFALDQNSVTLDQFQINTTTGVLSQFAGASYTGNGVTVVPRAVKIAPNGAYVFIAIGTAGDLVYPFNTSTGALSTPLALSLPANTSDNALAVSPNSTYLYIARSGAVDGLAAYLIGSGGSLTAVSGSPYAAGNQPFSVAVSNDGSFVYLANQLDSSISAYRVTSNGTLNSLIGSPFANWIGCYSAGNRPDGHLPACGLSCRNTRSEYVQL